MSGFYSKPTYLYFWICISYYLLEELTSSSVSSSIYELQAEPVVDASVDEKISNEVAENITFSEVEGEKIDYSSLLDSTIDEDDDSIATLGNYLKRPVLIDTFTWTQTPMALSPKSMYPWPLFFTDSKIRAKVQNFARIRSKLHIKFVLNASPFFYGAIRVAYFPCKTAFNGVGDPYELVPASQTPGVWLTPQDMSTADLTLPFLCPSNWLNANSLTDYNNMGVLKFYVYSQLQSANGASGASITISTYAWAEDFEVAGPTASITLQAKPIPDESSGKISSVAGKAADVAGMLKKVPVIGSYASAAEFGARAVGKVAAMFGLSNAPNVSDVAPYQPKAFHAFANCETSMPVDKLAIDPKNEVVVDNRVAGTDSVDPLAFSNFCRESYFGQATWTTAMAPETNIATLGVTPAISMDTPGTKVITHYHTPLSYVARMFGKWRGSLIFRFKVINTKYHKGRLRLSWDPIGDLTGISDSETCCFTRIVDLEEENDIEFEVPYKALNVWLRTGFINRPYWNTSEASATAVDCNGFLSIKVQNILSAPTGSGTVQVLFFVRPGADFQFSVPNDLPSKFSPLPIQASPVVDGSSNKKGEHLTEITVGENIASLRPLLHRVSFSNRQFLGRPLTANNTYHLPGTVNTTNIISRTPPWFGYSNATMNYADSLLSPGTPLGFNWSVTHPMNWVLAAFAGYRGSVVVHVNLNAGGNVARIESASLAREPAPLMIDNKNNSNGRTSVWGILPSTFARDPTVVLNGYARYPTGQRGLTMTKEITQSALSCVSPQYANSRFSVKSPYRCDVEYTNTFDLSYWYDNFRLDTTFCTNVQPTASTPYPYADVYYSAGVDFQPVFFVCTPVLYEIDYPTPNDSYAPV